MKARGADILSGKAVSRRLLSWQIVNEGKHTLNRFLALACWLSICAGAVYWSTLDLPYAVDDIDQLQALASMRTGQISFLEWILLPHNEHSAFRSNALPDGDLVERPG